MKKTSLSKTQSPTSNEMRPEYDLDYRQARPNRFARRKKAGLMVVLDPDVAKVFTTPESVNTILRALIAAMPPPPKRKAAVK